jgi:hypothetical protein
MRKADNLTTICEPIVYRMSHNPMGLHGVTGLTLPFFYVYVLRNLEDGRLLSIRVV